MIDKADVSGETHDELEAIDTTRLRSVPCRGEVVQVTPLTIGQLPRFSKALRPLMNPLNAALDQGAFTVDAAVKLIEDHGEELLTAVSIAIERPRDWVGKAGVDEFVGLVVAVFAINLDFFVHRLLPEVGAIVHELAELLETLRGSGRTPSSSSSDAATH